VEFDDQNQFNEGRKFKISLEDTSSGMPDDEKENEKPKK
jgi:hypothetical protein